MANEKQKETKVEKQEETKTEKQTVDKKLFYTKHLAVLARKENTASTEKKKALLNALKGGK